MTKEERNKICKSCTNHIIDDRYGVMCSLTNNFAHFDLKCKDFNKKQSLEFNYETPSKSNSVFSKKKEKRGFSSLIGGGVALWIIFKILMKIFKSFSE